MVTRARWAQREAAGAPPLGDLRFRALLGADAWNRLPPAVRRRFSHRLAAGASAVYAGEVVETRMNRAGRLLAQLARLIGAPLPTSRFAPVPAVVSVTEDPAGGQVWTRLYGQARGFPQVIRSAKRFAGPTGLEEHVGAGVGMALTVHEEAGALLFRSDHYFVALGHMRLRLPRALAPGALTVGHHDLGHGRFAFTLSLVHPWFGELLHQRAHFHDMATADGA